MGLMDFKATLEVDNGLGLLFPHKKIGILGGTFNPIHNGHVDMALKIRQELSLDEVYLMPCGEPPHKRKSAELLAAKQKRLHMVAMCAYYNEGLKISDLEIKREGVTYTIDTLRELTQKEKDTDFYFVIGSDTLFELETWKEFRELFALTRFVCVRRQEHDKLRIVAEVARLAEQYGATILISAYSGLHVSSSYIRKRVAEGKSITEFVPDYIEEYMDETGLYK